MAWTAEKNELLRDLLRERVAVEQTIHEVQEWGLTRTWIQIINAYVTNVQKQAMLNDFVDDKVVYLNSKITAGQTYATQLASYRDDLLTNKE